MLLLLHLVCEDIGDAPHTTLGCVQPRQIERGLSALLSSRAIEIRSGLTLGSIGRPASRLDLAAEHRHRAPFRRVLPLLGLP